MNCFETKLVGLLVDEEIDSVTISRHKKKEKSTTYYRLDVTQGDQVAETTFSADEMEDDYDTIEDGVGGCDSV